MRTHYTPDNSVDSPKQMPSSPTILVVEDEAKLAALIGEYLQSAGFNYVAVANGDEVVSMFRRDHHDLVLLDLMLPKRNGLEVCRELRTFSDVPIIMITAMVEEVDRLRGLDLGADDYICKPFSPREVVARVRTILRRAVNPASTLKYLGFKIDDERMTAELDGKLLDLTSVELRLLKVLVSSPGKVFSRQKLLDGLYTDGRIVTDRTVDTHIKNLRRKVQQASPERVLIHSIYGAGYKLE